MGCKIRSSINLTSECTETEFEKKNRSKNSLFKLCWKTRVIILEYIVLRKSDSKLTTKPYFLGSQDDVERCLGYISMPNWPGIVGNDFPKTLTDRDIS